MARSLFSMTELQNEDILSIIHDGLRFETDKKEWKLPIKKSVANLFYENSTRTHFSFKYASLDLGMNVSDLDVGTSSVTKGESLYDTCKTFEAIGYDLLVIRHNEDEYYKKLQNIRIPILNAGDGRGSHPSQSLLDLMTIYQEFGAFKDLNVLIVGDIVNSRVAASNKEALTQLGAKVSFCGPKIWARDEYKFIDFDDAISEADVVMMLRVQMERGANLSDIKGDYLSNFGLTKERHKRMKKNAIIMHPAPINRGIEIDGDLVEADNSRIFKQMHNGMLVRKALIKRAFELDF